MRALLARDPKSLPELAPLFAVPRIRSISLAEAARDDKRILRISSRPAGIALEPDNGSILRIFTARRAGHK